MGRVDVELAPPYAVHVEPGVLSRVAGAIPPGGRCALLSDERVAPLHARRLTGLERIPRLLIPPGEASKCFARLEEVLDFLAASGLDRGSSLVVLGGGVPGDLGGLAASLYMRGIALVQCPTTLLAQVDASVGGKTAVNLQAGKNLAGTFHQPVAVFADTDVLSTLDEADWRSGLGEVLKTALIEGEELLHLVEQLVEPILARDPADLAEVVERCVRAKARVVASDPEERGPRRALNLGHTFAHAIERVAGFGAIAHGAAVAAGVSLALAASRELGLLREPSLPERAADLAGRLGLPTSLSDLRRESGQPLAAADLIEAMRLDKKGRESRTLLVLPRCAGELELEVEPDGEILVSLLA